MHFRHLFVTFRSPFRGPMWICLGLLFFNIFISYLCNVVKHCKCLLFADGVKFFCAINSIDDCNLLQSDIEHIRGWCTANFLKLSVSKTRVIAFPRKTNVLYYTYEICASSITCIDTIKDLGVQLDSKLQFHAHVDYIFSKSVRMPA
jgi:hypothetical protein